MDMTRDTGRRRTFAQRLKRLLYYRLVVPLRRNHEKPEYAARATAVGIFWAFTPLIPIQMSLLGLTWLLARPFSFLNFNPIIALAWIWVTNLATIIPVYFIFYVTGQMLLGRWEDLIGYKAFTKDWQAVTVNSGSFVETTKAAADLIIREQGLALGVGCLPYAIGGAWLGYLLSMRALRRYARGRRGRNPDATNGS